MAELDDKVIVTKSKITDIADALREEMSESYEYSLPTMVEKVHELGQGQGSEYTAGVGIDITNRVVSVVDTLMIRGSANGSVASIDDGADDIPLKSCIVAIEPVQSGSGDPSPSNVRPISGRTECNITVADDETTPTISNVYNIEFKDGTNLITIFLGTVALISKLLTVEDKGSMVDLGDLNWDKVPGQNKFYVADFNDAVKFHELNSPTQNIPENFVCSAYKVIGGKDAYDCTYDLTIGGSFFNGANYLLVNDSNYSTAADFKAGVQGVKLVYEVATPTTYQLNPIEIKTLLGINNIFADCGDVDVEYVRDATLIINKLLELVSGNNNRTMMKSAVVEKADEVQEQKKDSAEEDLDA